MCRCTNWPCETIRRLSCKIQIAALLLHTNHTQAAHLHWLHTSDCTSGVTCSMHDEFMCYLWVSPPQPSVSSPGLLAAVLLSCTYKKGSRGVEDSAVRVWIKWMDDFVMHHMAPRRSESRKSGLDTHWQFLMLSLQPQYSTPYWERWANILTRSEPCANPEQFFLRNNYSYQTFFWWTNADF